METAQLGPIKVVGASKAMFKMAKLGIKVIRANGDVEDFGIVAYWHKNPLKRWAYAVKKFWRKTWNSFTKFIARTRLPKSIR